MTRFLKLMAIAAVALPLSLVSWGATAATSNIVDTAASAGTFNTLLSAVKAAGLEEKLKGDGPYTVFAPTDAAFNALPDGKLEELLKPENKEKLVKILSYHVVPGKVGKAELSGKMMSKTTLQGAHLKIDWAGDKAKLNGQAAIQKPDVIASNGVIHVIDQVMTIQ